MRKNALRSETEIGFERRKGDGFGDGDDSFPYGVFGIAFTTNLDESLLEVYGIGMKAGDLFAADTCSDENGEDRPVSGR